MRHPWVNLLLLVLLAIELVTGFAGLTTGVASRGWWTWVHGAGGFGILALLAWKAAVIINAYQRGLEWNVHRLAFIGQILLLLVTLFTGLVWTFDGPHFFLGFSLVTFHIFLALAGGGLLFWHVWYMRFILRHPAAKERRTFLRLGLSALGGMALLLLWDRAKGILQVAGARRRFTGSYETGSFGGSFPVTAWIADRPPAVQGEPWRLSVQGAVEAPFSLSLEELSAMPPQTAIATLDCTGGWYTTQSWEGVSLGIILAQARISPSARSVTIASATGYQRRFPLAAAAAFLLALRVGGEPLSRGHGYPVRLVAGGRRGYDWVKWVQIVQVNETGPAWQSPLPLQ